jgi:hypothetical protein
LKSSPCPKQWGCSWRARHPEGPASAPNVTIGGQQSFTDRYPKLGVATDGMYVYLGDSIAGLDIVQFTSPGPTRTPTRTPSPTATATPFPRPVGGWPQNLFFPVITKAF